MTPAGAARSAPVNAVLEAARKYTRAGRRVVPVPHGEKNPGRKGWQNMRLEEADLAKCFHGPENVGLLLGEASAGLIDIDLDHLLTARAADFFLPPTGMVSGRPGKPRSHRWYLADPIPKPEKFVDPTNDAVLGEIRSNGQQTIVPPSVHPLGEPIRWEQEGEPAKVSAATLQLAVARAMAAVLAALHWPALGTRHEVSLPFAGLLLRGGWAKEETRKFIETVAQLAGDEEWQARGADVETTARRIEENAVATGKPRLAQLIGPKVVEQLCRWLKLGRNLVEQEGIDAGPYLIEKGRICIVRMKEHGPIQIPLCNFVARVTEEIILDDGLESTRAFVLEGELASGEQLPPIRVAASRFTGMAWVPEHWGLAAVVSAGVSTRDQLREAIQRLSPNPRRRHVFTHTGWREIDGSWIYLHAGGGLGGEDLGVDLGPELARYRLPSALEDAREALRASLRLLKVGPLTVIVPLWAAVFRAPLASACPADLSLWIESATGNLKSTIAALFLSHFGEFDRTSLPGTWSSTANQLERRAFVLKDALFVIDDYAPGPFDARELEMKAARLLRAQGNLAGRGRLRADLTERPAYPPRGLIIGTGEQHPPGQSLLARTLLVELDRKSVDLAALTEAQRMATRLPHAMGAYLLWLAPQMPKLPALLRQAFHGARSVATAAGEHLRVPEALAHLWVGLDCALRFAEEVDACSGAEADEQRKHCWQAIVELGRAQAHAVEGERPSRRFVSVLMTILMQRRGALLPKETAINEQEGLLGWFDENSLYLLPEAAYQAVGRFCRDAGEPFPVRQEQLLRHLNREGLSDCTPGRNTTTARLGGQIRRVVRLRRNSLEQLAGGQTPAFVPTVTDVTGSWE